MHLKNGNSAVEVEWVAVKNGQRTGRRNWQLTKETGKVGYTQGLKRQRRNEGLECNDKDDRPTADRAGAKGFQMEQVGQHVCEETRSLKDGLIRFPHALAACSARGKVGRCSMEQAERGRLRPVLIRRLRCNSCSLSVVSF